MKESDLKYAIQRADLEGGSIVEFPDRKKFSFRFEDGDFGSYMFDVSYESIKDAQKRFSISEVNALIYCLVEGKHKHTPTAN